MSLQVHQASLTVDHRQLLQQATVNLRPGRIHALLGPNGAGKTSLLKILAGDCRPSTGRASLNGRSLTDWSELKLARRRAVMPQQDELRFGFAVTEVVRLGRLPWAESSAMSQPWIDETLSTFDLAALRNLPYTRLSGGERARVQLARACVQIAGSDAERYLLLDEPFASLDIAHQLNCQQALSRLAASGVGVLVVMHAPALALAWADDCTLIRDGQVLASGPSDTTLTEETLTQLYGLPLQITCSNNGIHKFVIPSGS